MQFELTDDVRARFLELLAASPEAGNVVTLAQAFKDCGQHVYKSEVKPLLDDDLEQQAREARGWVTNRIEGVRWEVALDKTHTQWERANLSLLKAYHPAFADRSKLELSGPEGGPIAVEDRSASLHDVQRVLTAALDSSPDDQDALAAAGGSVAPPGSV